MSRLSSPPLSIIRMHQQCAYSDTLLRRGNFVIPTTNSDHTALPLFTQSISTHFCGHAHLESTKLAFIVHFSEFLRARTYKGDLCFILTWLLPQGLIWFFPPFSSSHVLMGLYLQNYPGSGRSSISAGVKISNFHVSSKATLVEDE